MNIFTLWRVTKMLAEMVFWERIIIAIIGIIIVFFYFVASIAVPDEIFFALSVLYFLLGWPLFCISCAVLRWIERGSK